MHCNDVSGFQGHYKKHYVGIRNIKRNGKKLLPTKNIQTHLQFTDEIESVR